jgi:hypothetical protein
MINVTRGASGGVSGAGLFQERVFWSGCRKFPKPFGRCWVPLWVGDDRRHLWTLAVLGRVLFSKVLAESGRGVIRRGDSFDHAPLHKVGWRICNFGSCDCCCGCGCDYCSCKLYVNSRMKINVFPGPPCSMGYFGSCVCCAHEDLDNSNFGHILDNSKCSTYPQRHLPQHCSLTFNCEHILDKSKFSSFVWDVGCRMLDVALPAKW